MDELSLLDSLIIRFTGGPGVSADVQQMRVVICSQKMRKNQERCASDTGLTEDLDHDGVHLHSCRALHAQNVFASIVSVHILHHHRGVSVGGFNNDALAVLDVCVHLCPGDPGNGAALDIGVQPHGDAGI